MQLALITEEYLCVVVTDVCTNSTTKQMIARGSDDEESAEN